MKTPTFLIIKPSSLGDIVHALLVAQMIKRGFPESRIDWVCRDIFAPLIHACPFVDNVFLFERHGGIAAFLRLIRTIRRQRYDWILDMQGLARSGLITALSRAETSIGRSDAREGARFVYTMRAPLPPTGVQSHAVTILSEFLPLLGLPRDVVPRLAIHPDNVDFRKDLAMPSAPILLFPESRRVEKNWPCFSRLTRDLRESFQDVPVAWAGAEAMPSPSDASERNFRNLTGKTSLQELLKLLSEARLVIGNDSGPLHLAAALGVPTLALFGPTDPARYRPYPGDDRLNRILRAPEGDFHRLQPETVLEAIREILT
ncbi:heptosyltransferase I [Desulfonatronum thiosulfatophilum]|uniref:Heptosyltransferase I n=1 Tax=Desulfonatronum thiosulfatophilum TaxID=617002 RepID=A0A1G6DPY8_9BACT|nr:glycosyltransferase family 9 protein [Desulfonatronum thiosulfatophilum]SDB46845.1 heptosyltransferase I [Desulfonatronum thiosulfatophilum]